MWSYDSRETSNLFVAPKESCNAFKWTFYYVGAVCNSGLRLFVISLEKR